MKKLKYLISTTLLITLSIISIYGQELDENLKLLEPLTNKIWQSEMEGLSGEGIIVIQREWKPIWGGKAIAYNYKAEKLNVYTEGYLFWDPDKQEIGLFTINNKGRFMQGHVKEEDGKLLFYGYITFPDKKLEFRNIFEFTEDGNILDYWYRFTDGEWKAGHAVELVVKRKML